MTRISDEIRKVADEYDVTPLYALADRIDAEMVELPRDANNELIHLGDKTYDLNGDEQTAISFQLLLWLASLVAALLVPLVQWLIWEG